jgi:hypothetical protein
MRRLPPDVLSKLILSVGTQRKVRPLSPVEVAEAFDLEIMAGTTPDELAELCHLEGPTMVGRFRRLLRLSSSVRHIVDWGKGPASISFTVAQHIARLRDHPSQESLCNATLEYNLSAGEVQQVIQIVERSSSSAADAIQAVLRLRPVVERHYVFIGAITDQELRDALGALTQRDRNALMRTALTRRYPNISEAGGSLGVDRFSLVGGDGFAKFMSNLPGGFEKAVNDQLTQEVLRRDTTSS